MCDPESETRISFKDRIDILTALLDRIDRWLRYAENKNGVLLTLSIAAIGLALRVVPDSTSGLSFCLLWL